MGESRGLDFLQALKEESPLQIIGVFNAYTALMAKEAGFRALYLSGAGVANLSYALPDLALTTLDNVLEEASRITRACDLPLLVDVDTGFGSSLMVERTVELMESVGVAAIHMEDQVLQKRCGHRPNKQLVSLEEMVEKIESAVSSRKDSNFLIMARTDALAVEGLEKTIERIIQYKKAGADLLFLEASTSLQTYRDVKNRVDIPLLANLTEFGKTELYSIEELKAHGVDMALYPLTLSRAMMQTAEDLLKDLREKKTQKEWLGRMQTRDMLYRYLNYEALEKKVDAKIKKPTV